MGETRAHATGDIAHPGSLTDSLHLPESLSMDACDVSTGWISQGQEVADHSHVYQVYLSSKFSLSVLAEEPVRQEVLGDPKSHEGRVGGGIWQAEWGRKAGTHHHALEAERSQSDVHGRISEYLAGPGLRKKRWA